MKKIIFILLIIINSCGQECKQITIENDIDRELSYYVDNYINDSKKYNFLDYQYKLTIKIGSLSIDKNMDNVVGVCYYSKNLIIIDENRWYTLKEYQKEIVVYHELGHCLQDKEHPKVDTNYDIIERKDSIMNELLYITEQDYYENRDLYIEELFFDRNNVIDFDACYYEKRIPSF